MRKCKNCERFVKSGCEHCTPLCNGCKTRERMAKIRAIKVAERTVEDQPLDYKVVRLLGGELTKVSNEDYQWVSELLWRNNSRGYAVTGQGRLLHQLVSGYNRSKHSGLIVDHINRDKLDNRRENLRITTQEYNSHNSGPSRRTKHGYKGIYQFSETSFHVFIAPRGKNIRVGIFKTPEEAAWMYDQWALQIFGEHAYTNFEYV